MNTRTNARASADFYPHVCDVHMQCLGFVVPHRLKNDRCCVCVCVVCVWVFPQKREVLVSIPQYVADPLRGTIHSERCVCLYARSWPERQHRMRMLVFNPHVVSSNESWVPSISWVLSMNKRLWYKA
ncbi:hypothetical protein DNTS_017138 [Danionella cerebrum]|uniref:Uncharacterized protein n=1 Tax=Danionella cerebrum TaxID=2873325 RepID=A0A553NG76_9TELE|nr:hypothetical protein DNTS_017138 [Danionella translucida]